MSAPPPSIDLRRLFREIDERRRDQGMTWAAVGRATGVAPSTIQRTELGGIMEADGVWAMVRWLDRSIAHYCSGSPPVRHASPVRELRRFDARAFYTLLDRSCRDRSLSWAQAAREVGGTASAEGLRRLARGGRMSIQQVVRMSAWLGRAPEQFSREASPVVGRPHSRDPRTSARTKLD